MDLNLDHGEEAQWEEVERLALIVMAWEDAMEDLDDATQTGRDGHRGGTPGLGDRNMDNPGGLPPIFCGCMVPKASVQVRAAHNAL
ncbi:hypothetical protein CYMTET_33729 [Cymbomonas tetramitiformis]|uniref:Uncharacterized protein n=1 Tax=Cymbomonas tetramitiformis TaxID=36881 RepID=A0AAE0FCF4_9CHLO|nr:hypothetical protein CYMTET_33729 [Cymbomonas tetramitiformis]